jgi:hypothetical protein
MSDQSTSTDERDPTEPVVHHTEARGPNQPEGTEPRGLDRELAPEIAVEEDDRPDPAASTVPTASEGEER